MHDNLSILENRISRTWRERIVPAASPRLRGVRVERFDVTDAAGAVGTPAHPVTNAPGQGEPVGAAGVLGVGGSAGGAAEGAAGSAAGGSVPWRECAVGDAWGPAWGTTWFRLTVAVSAEDVAAWPDGLELAVDLGWEDHSPGFQAEGLVYDGAGRIVKAVNPKNQWVPVAREAGEQVFYVEASAVPLLLGVPPFIPTEQGRKTTAGPEPIYRLARAELVGVHAAARRFAARLEAIAGLGAHLPEGSARRWEIATQASAALDLVDLGSPERVRATAARADAALDGLYASGAAPGEHTAWAVGHAHIDSAWLWPLRETRRKAVRTLANVVRLLEDGADFVFALPAAQHAAWIEADAPELFARVVEWARRGRIVPVGGMWVEPDAVLPAGESLCRQILLGQGYFLEKFGRTCPQVWLPDSFGYSGALPQIARAGGAEWFLTQKISWNQVDRFPHHTLLWEGIDGTRIFTHFPPADTYGSDLSAENLLHARENFKDKGRAGVSLVPFGYGDGGGGPTREMIERGHLYADLAGAPRVRFEGPDEFYAAARADYPEPAVWMGELYLELHRGTFTSQAETKRGNRRTEGLLREAEAWCAAAAAAGLMEYPAEGLREAWREACLYQFHDILPGTSIGWVYDEVSAAYAELAERLRGWRDAALRALGAAALGGAGGGAGGAVGAGAGGSGAGAGSGSGSAGAGAAGREVCVVANAGPFAQDVAGVSVPGGAAQVRAVEAGASGAGSGAATGVGDAQVRCQTLADGRVVLENPQVKAIIGAGGAVESLVDKASGREAVPPGRALGTLSLYQDFPNMWDAWDVDVFYRGSRQVIRGEAMPRAEAGATPAHAIVHADVSFGDSRAEFAWSLGAAGGLRLDLRVDWRESEKFLKLDLPLDVHSERAAWEAAMGHVWRPLHENTSWDAYRFEVSAHRWMYVEEPGFGVAVANTRTYGWSARRAERSGGGAFTEVGASLLRAPRYPDPVTDRGVHQFGFEILPGAGLADAVAAGYRANLPVRAVSLRGGAAAGVGGSAAGGAGAGAGGAGGVGGAGGAGGVGGSAAGGAGGAGGVVPGAEVLAEVKPLITPGPGAAIEAVKLAEDGSGDVIVRLYEYLGARARVSLSVAAGWGVREADVLERELGAGGADLPRAWDPGARELSLHPFQIVTLRLKKEA